MSPISRPKQFTNFPALPKELRIKIWQYAAAQINWLIMFQTTNSTFPGVPKFTSLRSPTPYIALLCANSEARDEALKDYIKVDGPNFQMPFYFNFWKDTVYLKGDHWDDDKISYLVDSLAKNMRGTLVRVWRHGIEFWMAGFSPEGYAMPVPSLWRLPSGRLSITRLRNRDTGEFIM
jgi:hypothetical protein